MSRIGSSSGVRVAAQPLSNVYTVLLLVTALLLLVVAIFAGMSLQEMAGGTLGFGEEADQMLTQAQSAVQAGERQLAQLAEGSAAGAGTAPDAN